MPPPPPVQESRRLCHTRVTFVSVRKSSCCTPHCFFARHCGFAAALRWCLMFPNLPVVLSSPSVPSSPTAGTGAGAGSGAGAGAGAGAGVGARVDVAVDGRRAAGSADTGDGHRAVSLAFGAKISGGVPFVLPAVDVTGAVDADVVDGLLAPEPKPSDLKLPSVPLLRPGALPEVAAAPGARKVMARIRHQTVDALGLCPDTGMLLCRVSHPTVSKGGAVSPGPIRLLAVDPAALMDARVVDALLAPDQHAVTYKWNGENWMVEMDADAGTVTFFRRYDRRPFDVVALLAKNVANLSHPADVDLYRAATTAAAAGPHAIVWFVAEAMADKDSAAHTDTLDAALAGDSSAIRATLALPFTTLPFRKAVFWQPARRAGRRSKPARAPSAPAVERAWSVLRRSVGVAPRARAPTPAAAPSSATGALLPPEKEPLVLTVDAGDFKPVPHGGWKSAVGPDAITLHWPGYVPCAQLRPATDGASPWVYVPVSALPEEDDVDAWGAVLSSTSCNDSPTAASAAADRESVRDGAGATLHWPQHWETLPGCPTGATAASAVMPAKDAMASKLIKQAPMPAHALHAVQLFVDRAKFYDAWLPGVLALLDGDAAAATTTSWSFEMCGALYQGNPEGLPASAPAVLVPHTWFPRGPFRGMDTARAALRSAAAAVAAAAANDEEKEKEKEKEEDEGPSAPQLPIPALAYFSLQAAFLADPRGLHMKEGVVVHRGGLSFKVRRDDFGFVPSPALLTAMNADPVLHVDDLRAE